MLHFVCRKRMVKKSGILIVLLLLAVGSTYCLIRKSDKIKIKIRKQQAHVYFELSTSTNITIDTLYIWDVKSRSPYWAVELQSLKKGFIEYGNVTQPYESQIQKVCNTYWQTFPPDKTMAAPLPSNEWFYIEVAYEAPFIGGFAIRRASYQFFNEANTAVLRIVKIPTSETTALFHPLWYGDNN